MNHPTICGWGWSRVGIRTKQLGVKRRLQNNASAERLAVRHA